MGVENKIRVMLVEDHPEYRDVVELALEKERDIDLATQYGTAERALRSLGDCAASERPDIILLDLHLPGMSGLNAIPSFRDAAPDAKILVLTQSKKEADVLRAISVGASGYLLKSSTVLQIKEAIRNVMTGGASLDAGVAKYILRTFQSEHPTVQPEKSLSERELEILTLLADGLVKKQIAKQLQISYSTVDFHVRNIYDKLDVTNAPAAVNRAHRLNIFFKPGDSNT